MKVNVIKRSKNELKIEIEGESHTFCSALQRMLLEDKSIEFAGYDLPHPLVAQPIIYVRTKGSKTPEKALINATEKLGKQMEEFQKAFEKALEDKKE